MRAHVKQDYRDTKSGTAAGLRRFLQMTFSTKGLQVEELNARKQRGWRRVGRGMAQRSARITRTPQGLKIIFPKIMPAKSQTQV